MWLCCALHFCDGAMMNCFCRIAITIPFHNVHLTDVSSDCNNKFHTFLRNVSEWAVFAGQTGSLMVSNMLSAMSDDVSIRKKLELLGKSMDDIRYDWTPTSEHEFHFLLCPLTQQIPRSMWGSLSSGIIGRWGAEIKIWSSWNIIF